MIWYFLNAKTLSRQAGEVIDEIFLGDQVCYISVMVMLEALHFSFKHPEFIFSEFYDALTRNNIVIVSFDKEIMEVAFELPKYMDIHDRIIVATALATGTKLVTKDKVIRESGMVETVW